MSFLFPSRCVLILGDEGVQVYNVGRMSARFIDFVSWDNATFESVVSNLIIKRCGRSPVVILNDMVEQHYRKERIPKVTILDQANILKRRLSVAFPNYKVRAALKLKESNATAAQRAKGTQYLFAAIPASEAFGKVMTAVRRSNAPIVGFYLLPVEGAAMVKALSAKLTKGQRHKADWTIFVGQHMNGGLRQIVIRNGELALTRLTPIVDTDVEPDLWAKEVSGELNATMSYLARLGYKDSDGLDIIIVANEASRESLESAITAECNLLVLSSLDVASQIGVQLGRQDDLRYADAVHAAYVGKLRKFELPMQSAAIDRLTQPRRMANYAAIALLAGAAYFGYALFQNWNQSLDMDDLLKVSIQQNQSLRQEFNIEVEKKKALGFDFLYVNNSIQIFDELEKDKMRPLPVIEGIGKSLGAELFIDRLLIKQEKFKKEAVNADPYAYVTETKPDEVYALTATMAIFFPNTINPDVGVEAINSLKGRLEANLPDYEVQITKQVADLSYTGNFVGGAGSKSDKEVPENYEAELYIKRKLQ